MLSQCRKKGRELNRTELERREYKPYGKQLTPTPQDGPGYTGHVFDAATGLVYAQQRYYDDDIGRFLSADPVTPYGSPVGQFNRYRYGNDNPYRFVDPDGRVSDEPDRQHRGSMRDWRSLASKSASYTRDGQITGGMRSAQAEAANKRREARAIERRLLSERLDNYVEIDEVAGTIDKSMEEASVLDRALGNAGNWTQKSRSRYMYTSQGWVDLKHVAGAASLPFGVQLGDMYEFKQNLSGSYSAWVSEDIRSNSIGGAALNLSISTRGMFSVGQSVQILINGYRPYTEDQARAILSSGEDGP